jgi:hypothetical protein
MENYFFAQVTGKRKRELGLVVAARFSAFTQQTCVLPKFWSQSYIKYL